jgi:predicted dehydrogenase
MAPHAETDHDEILPHPETITRLPAPSRPPFSTSPPRILIIGAGNRGNAYASAIQTSSNGILVGVVEPIEVKRRLLGRKFIWGKREPKEGESFGDWREFVAWESERRMKERDGMGKGEGEGVDAVFICVQDQMHKEVVLGLAPLGVHILCEKPLATSLHDCVEIYRSLMGGRETLFGIGHVLRYSPHNMLLRKLVREDRVIGDVMAVNHTEPVGWWHFTHSYVRYVSLLLPFKCV